MLDYGGYSEIWFPPRNDAIFPVKYRNNKNFIQRYTAQTQENIKLGEKARRIFDPENERSSPVLDYFKREDGYFSQILPYRQSKFRDFIRENRDNASLYWKTMRLMLGFLEGLERLHRHRLIHRDIKIDNIVYDQKPRFNIFLIDWGTASSFKHVYNPDNRFWLTAVNDNIPPEFKMIAHMKYKHKYLNDNIKNDFNANHSIPFIIILFPDYPNMLEQAEMKIKQQFKHASDKEALLSKIAPKTDIFALGIVFIQIYIYMMSKHNIKPILKQQLLELFFHMIDPDPFTRWTARQAKNHLRTLLEYKSSTKTRSKTLSALTKRKTTSSKENPQTKNT